MTYKGINFCDSCGALLEAGRWIHGVCASCEQAAKGGKRRPVEIVKVGRKLL